MTFPSQAALLAVSIDWHAFFFMLFASLACVFAVAVLVASNIVRMAFYLILCLGSSAGLFFLAGAEFVGAMQLMIYVGGTLVLLVFGVMLTAQERFVSMKTRSGEWVLALIVGSALLAVLINTAFSVDDWRTGRDVLFVLPASFAEELEGTREPVSDELRLAFAGEGIDLSSEALIWRGRVEDGRDVYTTVVDDEAIAVYRAVPLADSKQATALGAGLAGVRVDQLDETDAVLRDGMSGYLLPFVIVSVHLLVVLIGAAYMARTKRYRPTAARPRPAPQAESAPKVRQWPALIWIGLNLIGNLVLAGLLAWNAPRILNLVFLERIAVTDWLVGALIFTALLRAVGLAALLNWKEWGLYLVAALALLDAALVYQVAEASWIALVVLAAEAAGVAVLFGFLRLGGEQSMWKQLD